MFKKIAKYAQIYRQKLYAAKTKKTEESRRFSIGSQGSGRYDRGDGVIITAEGEILAREIIRYKDSRPDRVSGLYLQLDTTVLVKVLCCESSSREISCPGCRKRIIIYRGIGQSAARCRYCKIWFTGA